MQTETILITGGLGYIGSHTVIELLDSLHKNKLTLSGSNYNVVVLDDLSNTKLSVADRVNKILKDHCKLESKEDFFEFEQVSVLNLPDLEKVFEKRVQKGAPISHIIHFAAKKAVVESLKLPLEYFETNFIGTFNILKCMEKYNCKKLIFSSTCNIYGNNKSCKEDSPAMFVNPYASSKGCVDYMLDAMAMCKSDWSLISLRYFNTCGAHETGLIGECPPKYPNNLFPYIEEVVTGKREILSVFGNDYPTKAGTGVRDYIHVVDLAKAHLSALNKLKDITGHPVFNIGTGTGYSVLDIIKSYSNVIGREVPHKIVGRRPGDTDITLSSSDKATKELGWKAEKTLDDMCKDSYRWRSQNPDGFE